MRTKLLMGGTGHILTPALFTFSLTKKLLSALLFTHRVNHPHTFIVAFSRAKLLNRSGTRFKPSPLSTERTLPRNQLNFCGHVPMIPYI